MIRRVRLSNWRAYESADLPFDDGTTFVVAPNGIGKTSLIEAAQFAFTGDIASMSMPVLVGADKATVEMTVQLPESRVVRIMRSVYADPEIQPDFGARYLDKELSEPQFRTLIEDAYGATVDFVARNALLSDQLQDVPDLDLRSLLARAFGLDDRRRDIDQLTGMLPDLEGDAVELGRAVRSEKKEQSRLADELVAARRALDESTVRLESVRAELDEVTAARDVHLQRQEATDRYDRWYDEYQSVADEAAAIVGDDVGPEQLADVVHAALTRTEAERREVEASAAALRARIAMIDGALGELDGAEGSCPVCRRPLGPDERSLAEREHRAELDQLRRELAAVDVDAIADRSNSLQTLLRTVDRLGPVPDRPTADDNYTDGDDDIDDTYMMLRANLESAVSDRDEAAAVVARTEADLDEARELAERSEQSVVAWRRWALTSAAVSALSSTIDDALNAGLEPVASAVTERWNSLFADRPDLQFDLDGDMWRGVRGERLEVDAFSAGERTAARLLVHLAILTTATDIPFFWVDEPLEHLDPQTRRLVAGMLANSRRRLDLRQVVVTTYEEQLAQRLADADDDRLTRVQYIRAGSSSAAQ